MLPIPLAEMFRSILVQSKYTDVGSLKIAGFPGGRTDHMNNATQDHVRILLVDDHELFRKALRLLCDHQADLQVVAEAATEADAVRLAEREQPDVILLDLDLGHDLGTASGLSAITALRAVADRSRIIVLTGVSDTALHRRAVRQGAVGLLHKNQSPADLVRAIKCVVQGQAYLDMGLVATVVTELSRAQGTDQTDPEVAQIATLTERERAVVALVCEGLPNKLIAVRLSISETTVRHHMTSIFNKLGVVSRVELVIYAYRHGLVPPPADRP